MRIGRLNKRVIIQTATETADGVGQLIKSWADTDTVWAAIQPSTGNEEILENQQIGIVTHEIKIRYNANVTVQNRIKFGTRIFEIASKLNWKEGNREMTLMCKELV